MKELDILCLGEPMVEFNHIGGGQWLEGFGGDVSNVAVAAARQGAKAGMATRVGTDMFGQRLCELWADEGIDTRAVMRDDDAPTGIYFIRHTAEGHAFEYRRAGSAASRLSPATLPLDAVNAARVLHLSGITQAISDSACEAGFAAIEAARAAGVTVAYDPNLRLALWSLDDARAVIHRAMAGVDIALPGIDDARQLTGLDKPEDIVRFYRDLGPGIVALTLGEEGALISAGDDLIHLPPHPVTALDASGAGDCFDGAFLARFVATGDARVAGEHAAVAAALAVTGYGAVAPLPRLDDVLEEMDGYRAAMA